MDSRIFSGNNCMGIPVPLFIRAAEFNFCPMEDIIGKKLLRKVKIIIGSAIAVIITAIINVLLSICCINFF